ncbi:MAG: hypothetical protein R3F08_06210 [Dokdonella sp.]|nr:hypothetical protein [Dokdonella sp.]
MPFESTLLCAIRRLSLPSVDTLRAYVTVGALFGLLTLSHPARAVDNWAIDVSVPDAATAAATCVDENTDPWEAGSTAINPGAWANVMRGGTGWEFIYSDDRLSVKAILFTYSHEGKPIWLATNMTALQPDGNWKAKFYKHTATSATAETLTHAGSVEQQPGHAQFGSCKTKEPSRQSARCRQGAGDGRG